MFVRVRMAVLFALLGVCKTQVDFGPECQYHGDMCEVDPNDCLQKMREKKVFTRACEDWRVRQGPEHLFDSRGDVEYWLDFVPAFRDYFPDDLTYTIVRRRAENWYVPGSVSQIGDCCSLGVNDTCILPKKQPGEDLFAFIPLRNTPGQSSWYCEMPIRDEPGVLDWCEDEDSHFCLEFKDGILRVRNFFVPLSVESYAPSADYCFFSIPDEHVPVENVSVPPSRITRAVKGIDVVASGGGVHAHLDTGNKVPCMLEGNVTRKSIVDISAKYQKYEKLPCFVARSEVNRVWTSSLRCVLPGISESLSVGVVVGVVLAASTFFLLVIAVLIWAYKEHLKVCCPSFEKSIKEMPGELMANSREGNTAADVNANGKNSPAKEVPDEITFVTKDGVSRGAEPGERAKSKDAVFTVSKVNEKSEFVDEPEDTKLKAGARLRQDSGYQPEEDEKKRDKEADDSNSESSPIYILDSGYSTTREDLSANTTTNNSKDVPGFVAANCIGDGYTSKHEISTDPQDVVNNKYPLLPGYESTGDGVGTKISPYDEIPKYLKKSERVHETRPEIIGECNA